MSLRPTISMKQDPALKEWQWWWWQWWRKREDILEWVKEKLNEGEVSLPEVADDDVPLF